MDVRTAITRTWPLALGLALYTGGSAPALAAPAKAAVQLAIGSPLPNSLVGGRISLAVSYDAGAARVRAFTVYVDDTIQFSRGYMQLKPRGVNYLEIDTRTIPDGVHTIRVVAVGDAGIVASDSVPLVVRNGTPGGLDLVPPLLHFRNLVDGDVVSGKIAVDLLAEDNRSSDLLVSIFVNRNPYLITSRRPYGIQLDTAEFLDPATGLGSLTLEAFAFDTAGNRGIAPPLNLSVRVAAPVNLTPNLDPAPRAASKGQPVVAVPAPPPMASAPAPEPVRPEASPLLADQPAGSPGGKPLTAAPDQPAALPAEAPAPLTGGGAIGAPAPGTPRSAQPPATRPRAIDTARAPAPGGGLVLQLPARAPMLGGARSAEPAAKPSVPQPPTVMAKAAPVNPPAEATKSPAQPKIAVRPLPGAQAKAPAAPGRGPLLIVPENGAKPDEAGRVRGTVYEVQTAPAERVALTEKVLPKDRMHKVVKGESLLQIARRYRVTPRSLMVANGLSDARKVNAGSQLRVPGAFQVAYNNKTIKFDVPPRVENGLALAPFRQIFEHTGGVVVWYHDTKQIRASNDRAEVKLHIGSKEALVNQMVILMDREAFIDSGRTIVPIAFVRKALDLTAEYDVRTGTIHLVRK